MKTIEAFWRNEAAVTSVEYAFIGFLISIGIVAGATAIGTRLSSKFGMISNNLN